jgi:hypothetical protein
VNVFIVGSGFTKAVFSNAPLNHELLDALAKNSHSSFAQTLCNQYKTKDIEIALTRLDADMAESPTNVLELKELRRGIEDELAQFFASFPVTEKLLDSLPWLTRFVDKIFSRGDVIISLNYDCVLEGALDLQGKWSPKGGYGSLDNFLASVGGDIKKSPVTVLKIHGSANFVSAPYLDKPACESINFEFDERFFPRSAKNIHFSFGAGTGKPYVIAPSYIKIPSLDMVYLMLDALKASSRAKNLVVVGCSLRPEDGFLTVLTTNFLRNPAWRTRKLIVVDPLAKKVTDRIKNFWGVNISEQLVPIENRLEVSVENLLSFVARVKPKVPGSN